jgi:hypothetical protein
MNESVITSCKKKFNMSVILVLTRDYGMTKDILQLQKDIRLYQVCNEKNVHCLPIKLVKAYQMAVEHSCVTILILMA